MINTQVVIYGTGTIGLTLAHSLKQQGINVIVYAIPTGTRQRTAPAKNKNHSAQVVALNRASENLLKQLGIWQQLTSQHKAPYSNMEIWEQSSPAQLSFSATEYQQSNLGHIVTVEPLIKCLQQGLEITTAKLDALKQHSSGLTLSFDNNTEVNCQLLVAADGKSSKVRSLAGFNTQQTPYNHHALACQISHEKSHQHTARQRFLSTGPLAFLPMADPHQSSIVWSTTPAQAEQLLALNPDEFHQTLGSNIEYCLGKINSSTQRLSFPLEEIRVEQLCKSRVVLVGDAAHALHPLAGQGMNLGLQDVQRLTQKLIKAQQKKQDLGKDSSIKPYQYEQQWKHKAYQLTMRLLKNKPSNQLTALGMNTLNHLPFIKKRLIQLALSQ